MSSQSLLKFLNKLDKDFDDNTPEDKRLEYNLLTHSFSYNQSTFTDEMISELKSKSIVLTKKRETEIIRLAKLFSADLHNDLTKLNEAAKAKNGITRFKGSSTSFSFVFTTDIRTGKTPNNWAQGQADVFDKIKVSYSNAYRKFFFGVMDNTKLLSGKLVIENDSLGYADITMNGITEKLPFSYLIKDKKFSMTTKMDVLNWNAKSSLDSLNLICKELHKGLDGISKTWSEVAINISSTF